MKVTKILAAGVMLLPILAANSAQAGFTYTFSGPSQVDQAWFDQGHSVSFRLHVEYTPIELPPDSPTVVWNNLLFDHYVGLQLFEGTPGQLLGSRQSNFWSVFTGAPWPGGEDGPLHADFYISAKFSAPGVYGATFFAESNEKYTRAPSPLCLIDPVCRENSGPVFDTTEIYRTADGYTFLTVSAVPEPETYAMMLAGLGLLGMTARRRNRL